MSYGYPPPYPPPYPPGALPPQFHASPAETVRPLAIGYIVYAVFVGFAAIAVPIYFLVIAAAITSAGSEMSSDEAGTAMAVGGFMTVVLAFVEMFLLIKLALLVLAIRGLFKLKSYGLCFAAAVVSCFNMPLGLALGVWSFFVLTKPEVKAAFT